MFITGGFKKQPVSDVVIGNSSKSCFERSKTLVRLTEAKLLHPAAVGLFDCDGVAVEAELLVF